MAARPTTVWPLASRNSPFSVHIRAMALASPLLKAAANLEAAITITSRSASPWAAAAGVWAGGCAHTLQPATATAPARQAAARIQRFIDASPGRNDFDEGMICRFHGTDIAGGEAAA